MSLPSDRPGDAGAEDIGAESTRPQPEPSTDKVDHAISGQMPGSVIASKYRVEGPIGRGGMGIVVRATHMALGQEVALKLLSGSSTESAVRFAREARLVVQLKSEHIARVIDFGEASPGKPYLVMELVRGETLAERLDRGGPLPLEEAIDCILQASLGLAEAHRAGIVHRDLKPSNLMLTERPDGSPLVKVLDFGIAKSAAAGDLTTSGERSNPRGASLALEETVPASGPTAAAVVLGSPFYMSPEQVASAHDVDARTDVWSLGVILHELVTGKVPFSGSTISDVLSAIQTKSPSLSFHDDAPSRALAAVALRCLEKDPRRRWATVAELSEALAPLATEESRSLPPQIARVLLRDTPNGRSARSSARTAVAAGAGAPLASTPPPSKRAWTPIVGGAVALAIAAGIAGALLARGGDAKPSSTSSAPPGPIASARAEEQPSASAPPSLSVAPTTREVVASAAPIVASESPCPPTMIYVPADSFVMGPGTTRGNEIASPRRVVKLGAYCIDRLEVTVAAYERCTNEPRGGIRCTPTKTAASWAETEPENRRKYNQCNAGDPARKDHPINCVDWEQSRTFCRWLAPSGALPTEAQWERAARGVDGRTYPWGEGPKNPRLANLCGEECAAFRKAHEMPDVETPYKARDAWPTTAPVGSFPGGASPIGALDMVGNVWEWTQDYYVPYDPEALQDPIGGRPDGPGKAKRVIRGSGWYDTLATPTYRGGYTPAFTYPDTGFRCAATPSR